MSSTTRTKRPAPAAVAVAHDFDEGRRLRDAIPADERSFRIGGVVFVYRPSVRPEVLLEFAAIDRGETDPWQTFEILDRTILSMIENGDGSHERYHALRQRDEDPLSIADLRDVAEWLVERQTDRTPTKQDSPSSIGRVSGDTK